MVIFGMSSKPFDVHDLRRIEDVDDKAIIVALDAKYDVT
jgi:hypothetical protein